MVQRFHIEVPVVAIKDSVGGLQGYYIEGKFKIAGGGGTVPLSSLGGSSPGATIYGGLASWGALAHPATAGNVLQTTTVPNAVAWSTNALTLNADATLDQDLETSDSPTFADVFVPDGGTFGISGNELLTVNAAGTFGFSGIAGITVENSDFIGIGAAAERLEFYTAGYAVFRGCDVGVGLSPATLFHTNAIDSAGSSGVSDATIVVGEAVTDSITFRVFVDQTNEYVSFDTVKYGVTNNIPFVLNAFGGNVGVNDTNPAGKLSVDQSDASGTIPVIELDQADLSEEFVNFISSVGAGYPIDTAAIGTYYGKIRVAVNGTFKYMALYNS